MKGKKIYSIFFNKCPRCHNAPFFKYNNPYKIPGFSEMPKRCPSCNQNFEPEVGFYYGSMYVSYAFNVAMGVGIFFLTWLLFPNTEAWMYVVIIVLMLFLLMPLTYRISRLVWINFFVHYLPDAEKKKLDAGNLS